MKNTPLFCSELQFKEIVDSIKKSNYRMLGPTVRDEVIVYDDIESADDLPVGRGDEQNPGHYRLTERKDGAYFGYNLGPHSWKQYLFPPKELLWSAKNDDNSLEIQEPLLENESMAFIGVRACELQALHVLDKVFANKYPQYESKRKKLLIVAVNCTTSANTCFCTSMNSYPPTQSGYDISLTEVIDDTQHYFIVEIGSKKGEEICSPLQMREATDDECFSGKNAINKALDNITRSIDNDNIHNALMESWESPRWNEIAKRCINCANCTMACPTCFCSNLEDTVSLDAKKVDHYQTWESCFNLSHSYVHGGGVRNSAQARYRQWLTHKFGTWWDQFGLSGCVGCGRCITWCPVGIDVTEELNHIQIEHNEKNKQDT